MTAFAFTVSKVKSVREDELFTRLNAAQELAEAMRELIRMQTLTEQVEWWEGELDRLESGWQDPDNDDAHDEAIERLRELSGDLRAIKETAWTAARAALAKYEGNKS